MRNLIEVARLVNTCGRVEGRVKLQKIVHILKEVGYPFKEEFGYLHHGPYSSDLKRELDQLVEWGLVNEDAEPAGEHTRYTYAPQERLAGVLLQIGAHEQPPWVELARELNGKCSHDLEAISTVMFLKQRGFEGDRLRIRFGELKPHLVSRFTRCAEEAKQLGRRGPKRETVRR